MAQLCILDEAVIQEDVIVIVVQEQSGVMRNFVLVAALDLHVDAVVVVVVIEVADEWQHDDDVVVVADNLTDSVTVLVIGVLLMKHVELAAYFVCCDVRPCRLFIYDIHNNKDEEG